jgi:hypothetical protein
MGAVRAANATACGSICSVHTCAPNGHRGMVLEQFPSRCSWRPPVSGHRHSLSCHISLYMGSAREKGMGTERVEVGKGRHFCTCICMSVRE